MPKSSLKCSGRQFGRNVRPTVRRASILGYSLSIVQTSPVWLVKEFIFTLALVQWAFVGARERYSASWIPNLSQRWTCSGT